MFKIKQELKDTPASSMENLKASLISSLHEVENELNKILAPSASFSPDEKQLCAPILKKITNFFATYRDRQDDIIILFATDLVNALTVTLGLFDTALSIYSAASIVKNLANTLQKILIQINPPKPLFQPTKEMLAIEQERVAEQKKLNSRDDFKTTLANIRIAALARGLPIKKIFISYAWPVSNEHEEAWTSDFVRTLANHLRAAGLLVYLDQNQSGFGTDMMHFMTENIKNADHVLVICDRTMRYKFEEMKLSGVCFEYLQIIAQWQDRQIQNHGKEHQNYVIPLCLNDKSFIPGLVAKAAEVSVYKDGYLRSLIQLIQRSYYGTSYSHQTAFEELWPEDLKIQANAGVANERATSASSSTISSFETTTQDQRFFSSSVSLSTPMASSTATESINSTQRLIKKASDILIETYLPWRQNKGLFGESTELKREYIHVELMGEVKRLKITKTTEQQNPNEPIAANLSSYADLFNEKKTIALENLFKADKEFLSQNELDTLIDRSAAEIKPRTVLVHGSAGRGKTTLAKYLAYFWALKLQNQKITFSENTGVDDNNAVVKEQANSFAEFNWVFVLFLKDLGQPIYKQNEPFTLAEWIYKACFKVQGLSLNDFEQLWQQSIEPALQQNKALIVLEGLDEEPPQHACKKVMELLTEGAYAKYSKLITSRPHATRLVPNDRNIEVSGFNDEGIRHFVEMYFPAQPTFANEFLSLLAKNHLLWANARLPLTLNILCWIVKKQTKAYKDSGQIELPKAFQTMTGLYEEMLIELLGRAYEAERRDNPDLDELPIQFKQIREAQLLGYYQQSLHCLSKIAYLGMLSSESTVISSTSIQQALMQCKKEDSTLNINNIIKKLYQLGLLRPTLTDENGNALEAENQTDEFLHFTFQEFFAAYYIVHQLKSNNKEIIQFISTNKYVLKYEITWWFVARLLKDDQKTLERFFDILDAEPVDLVGLNHQILLMRCLDEVWLTVGEQRKSRYLTTLGNWLSFDRYKIFSSSVIFQYLKLSPHVFHQPVVVTQVINLSRHPDVEVRIIAAELFATQSDLSQEAMTSLMNLFQDESKQVHPYARKALANQRKLSKEILDDLQKLFRLDDEQTRECIILLFTKHSVLNRFIDLMLDPDPSVSLNAAIALREIKNLSSEIVGRIVELLQDPNDHVRASAAEALNAGLISPEALVLLCNLLRDKCPRVRYYAARSLGFHSTLSDETLHLLCEILEDDCDPMERPHGYQATAFDTLAAQKTLPKEVMNRLMIYVRKNRWTPYQLGKIIGKRARYSKEAERCLIDLLQDEDWEVSSSVAWAIGNESIFWESQAILNCLLNLFNHTNPIVRGYAVYALRSSKLPLSLAVLKMVFDLLYDKLGNVAHYAQQVLNKQTMLPPEILQRFIELLAHQDKDLRNLAVNTISFLKLSNAIFDQLLNLFLNSDENTQEGIAFIFGIKSLFPQETIRILISHLSTLLQNKKPIIRLLGIHVVATAIEMKLDLPDKIMDRISNLLQDEDCSVRTKAISILLLSSAFQKQALECLIQDFLSDPYNIELIAMLSKQPALPENVLYNLITLLRNHDDDRRDAAFFALSNQSALPENIVIRLLQVRASFNYKCALNTLNEILNRQTNLPLKTLITIDRTRNFDTAYIANIQSFPHILMLVNSTNKEPIHPVLFKILVIKIFNEKLQTYIDGLTVIIGDRNRTITFDSETNLQQFAKCLQQHGGEISMSSSTNTGTSSNKGAPTMTELMVKQQSRETLIAAQPLDAVSEDHGTSSTGVQHTSSILQYK